MNVRAMTELVGIKARAHKMSESIGVLHGVEEVLYSVVLVPERLPTQESEVLAALPPGGGALRGGQGAMGRALRGIIWPLARLRRRCRVRLSRLRRPRARLRPRLL